MTGHNYEKKPLLKEGTRRQEPESWRLCEEGSKN
jgi:hypothetical protein